LGGIVCDTVRKRMDVEEEAWVGAQVTIAGRVTNWGWCLGGGGRELLGGPFK